jgi:hypothetical protein
MKKNLPIIVRIICVMFLVFVIQLAVVGSVHAEDNSWTQSGSDGFGNANNSHMHTFAQFKAELYTGTDNEIDGAELYKTSDGKKWTKIVGIDSVGMSPGFNDRSNKEIHFIIEYKSYLYASTYNPCNGTEIWRSKDGIKWDRIVDAGFGNDSNIDIQSMAILGNDLYAGTWNENGAEIYKTSDGTNWQKSAENGFGDKNNKIMISMATYNNYLYAGTRSWGIAGAIWRTNDGKNWEAVNTDGFGDKNNRSVDALTVFQDTLYASEYNTNGLEIYSTLDGTNWSKIVGSGLSSTNLSGFGAKDNISIFSLYAYDDKIFYAGTYNEKGAEIWSSVDGKVWNKMVGVGLNDSLSAGFNDSNNIAIDAFYKFDNYLYAGTDSSYYDEKTGKYLSKTGFEIWKEKLYDKPISDFGLKLDIVQNKYLWVTIIVLVLIAIIATLLFRHKKKQQMY